VSNAAVRTQPHNLQLTRSLLRLERIAHQDSVLPFRARREQSHRTADQLLDSADVFYRLRGQLGPGACAGGALVPARDRLVDRLDPRLGKLARRQIVDLAPVQPIPDADLDFVEPV